MKEKKFFDPNQLDDAGAVKVHSFESEAELLAFAKDHILVYMQPVSHDLDPPRFGTFILPIHRTVLKKLSH